MFKKKYYLNPDSLLFEPAKKSLKLRVRNGLIYISLLSVLAIGIRFGLDNYFTSPKVKFFTQQNEKLKKEYADLNLEIENAENILSDIQERDDVLYRSVLDLEPIPQSVREAGFGGSDNYEDLLLSRNKDFVSNTAQNLEMLRTKARIQTISLTDVYRIARMQKKLLDHKPSIQPISPEDRIWMTSTFGYRFDPFTKRKKMHHGVDLAGQIGLKVYATGDGVITEAQYNDSGYGREVVVDHGFGYVSRYAHLNKILVQKGQKVKRGELIGELGSSGRSTGPHLHYEIRSNNKYVNPLNYYYEDLSPMEYKAIISQAQN
jgi:murein DD-endopeptidase MepM/ murein hydrolase activator NlpD